MVSRPALATTAIAAALFVPATANAGFVSLDRPCYAEGDVVNFSGSGFPLTDTLTFSTPAAFTGNQIAFTGQFPAPIQPDNRVSAISTQTFTVTDQTNPAQSTSASFQLVNYTVSAGTSLKSPKKKRTWEFSGFAVGQPIYGHFRRKGKKVSDYKFGVASAPCGRLTKRAAGLPKAKKIKKGKYDVQFDTVPTYNAATRPAYLSSVRVFKVFK